MEKQTKPKGTFRMQSTDGLLHMMQVKKDLLIVMQQLDQTRFTDTINVYCLYVSLLDLEGCDAWMSTNGIWKYIEDFAGKSFDEEE